MTNHYNFIVIEGNIGAGKTTLSNMLAADFNARLILEQFSENPFLPFFYENPERYAFPVELFFMTERHRQLQESFSTTDLFLERTIADYFFVKTLLFAKNNLHSEEYRLFSNLFHVLNNNFPKPELMIYLHKSVPNLKDNIQKRGRSYEQNIADDYLNNIQQTYFEYFKSDVDFPVVIIDTDGIDFVNNPEHYQWIVDLVHQQHSKAVHRVSYQSLMPA